MNFLEILRALDESGVEFVIIGGVAARLYGSTRLTHDINIVPSLESEHWARLIETIWALGARPRIPEPQRAIQNPDNVKAWIAEKGMLALSFRTTDGTVEVDLVVSESPRFEELKSNARAVAVDGHTYLVAGIDDLIEMKKKAARPQDLLDVEQLERLK